MGNGKSNFTGAWDSNVAHDVRDIFPLRAESATWLAVPYSATPPVDINRLLWEVEYRSAFTKPEQESLTDLLGGLWTIPPDWRLDLKFQHHMLRKQKQPVVHLAKIFQEQLLELHKLGGSFEIVDIGSDELLFHSYTFQKPATASQIEEFKVPFPFKILRVTENGFPTELGNDAIALDSLQWTRLMYQNPDDIFSEGLTHLFYRTVRGLSDVYEDSPWQDDVRSKFKSLSFNLHTTCSLKANEQLIGRDPTVFHICWMDIGNTSTERKALHKAWARYPLHGSLGRNKPNIGAVAGTVRHSTIK